MGKKCKNCKLNCFEKIEKEQRKILFKEYGELQTKRERTLYLKGFIGRNKRFLANGSWHHTFFLPTIDGFKEQVCRTATCQYLE